MHIQLDPLGGAAGDMFVAALLDAFPALHGEVLSAVRMAGLPERFECELRPHADHALVGRLFLVLERKPGHLHDQEPGTLSHHPDSHHGHRPFAEIRAALGTSPLDPAVRDHALGIFTLLAAAEAEVHGATIESVSFHELGEWDSIADIVAASALIHALTPATWSVGPLPLGSGHVKSAHGLLPVPAPATAVLLRGLRVRDDGIPGERVTPTGAAIVRYLLSLPGAPEPVRTLRHSGLGFGTRTLPGIANCLRALVFDPAPASAASPDLVAAIEFEVDDQTPEDLAIGLDHVRCHPLVLDVLQTPAFGKKGRLVISVRVLCRVEAEDEVARLCFFETTTVGLRVSEVRRHTLSRRAEQVEAGGRRLGVKWVDRPGQVTSKVESDGLRDVPGHHERERLRQAARKE